MKKVVLVGICILILIINVGLISSDYSTIKFAKWKKMIIHQNI